MTEAPVAGLVARLAMPTVASMLVSNLYNAGDAWFVSRLGTSASGAVGIVFALLAVFMAFGFLFGHGAGSNLSRRLGAGDVAGARVFASTSFFLALGAGAAVAALGLVFLEPLARAFGSTETILPYAKQYMRWILLSGPLFSASCVMNNILRYEGRAALAIPCALGSARVVSWFRDDPEVVAIGAVALRWQALTVVLNHPTVCTNMLFQSLGLAGRAALLSTMRSGLFFFPLILLLPRAWGVLGVELAQPLADVLSFVVSMPFLAHWYRASKRGEG